MDIHDESIVIENENKEREEDKSIVASLFLYAIRSRAVIQVFL
jgi:hypothetical protein